MSKTLGSVVREARVKAGLTQRQLAAMVKKEDGDAITPQYLNDIEFDRRSPSEFVTRQIAKALSLDPDYLILLAGAVPRDWGITEETTRRAATLFRRRR